MSFETLAIEFIIILVVSLFTCLVIGICYVVAYFTSWYAIFGAISLAYWFSIMENTPSPDQIGKRKDTFVVIIGAGYSGLCTAIKLKQERIRFVLIEKSENVGGTWWDNKYPGCACDIMSHLYSLSFKPNPFWSRTFPSQPEILSYLEDTCDYYGIREHVKFGCKVERCTFDKSSQKWTVTTSQGEKIECNYLVSGIGALHVPKFPNIPGQDKFKGESFHTAQWKEDFDWTDKKVAVIGTGCSAVQVVPSIAPMCKELYVFQRTPSWILEQPDYPYPHIIQKCFQMFPFLMKLHRWYIFLRQELLGILVLNKGTKTAKFFQHIASALMQREIKDGALVQQLVPEYEMGCKRITASKFYLSTFNRSNVHLITTPITHITETAIQTEDEITKEVEFDAIIYATGFDSHGSVSNIGIERPEDGKLLTDVWGNTPNAYLGIMPPGFPNFFMLLGPTTILGHNSVVWMSECQIRFIVDAINTTSKNGFTSIEVTNEANEEFQSYVRSTMKNRVFSSGCVSWYQNSEGYNWILWPSNCFVYWWKTLRVNLNDFILS